MYGVNEVYIADWMARLFCMACTCSNCDFPSCFGIKSSGTCLCIEGYSVCCKTVNHPKACCLCWAGDYECIVPATCCKLYEQVCCWECFCAVPFADEGYRNAASTFVNMPGRQDGAGVGGDVTILR